MDENDMVPLSHGGYLSFDGAEGIAFWVNEGEDRNEASARVMLDDLPALRKFLAHWFPSTPPAGCNCGLDHRIPTQFGGVGRD